MVLTAAVLGTVTADAEPVVQVETPMAPPSWALLEREVLRAGSEAVFAFYDTYFDERGYLLHVARHGILDGTDDAIETFHNWTMFHALGGDDLVLDRYHRALEGHFRQYTEVTTTTTDIAAHGEYYREFYRHMDWLHTGEGLRSFFFQGLSDPEDYPYVNRMRRFAGFYMNEDPDAPNYDPEHHIIRSTLNGSSGPLLRRLTPEDWIGDPVPGKFHLLHSGDSSEMLDFEAEYPSMLAFIDDPVYERTAGDNPLNLATTNLATCAYLLTGEKKYRDWVLEYVGAWKERTAENGGIIPGNIGLDGVIGSAYDGKWYKGVFMWDRELYEGSLAGWGMWPGFGNAYLLTGDAAFIDALRRQIDIQYANGVEENGRMLVPNNFGENGWYHPRQYRFVPELVKIWLWSMDDADLARIGDDPWVAYLQGGNEGYPEKSLRNALALTRRQVERMRTDPTSPDTRLADWALQFNPVTTAALVELACGGHRIENGVDRLFGLLHCRVRYFDPTARRAGLPPDVAALVTAMTDDTVRLTLVNVNQVESRSVTIQGGAYGEHRIRDIVVGDAVHPVGGRAVTVHLAPGTGTELTIHDDRYASAPTMRFPWR